MEIRFQTHFTHSLSSALGLMSDAPSPFYLPHAMAPLPRPPLHLWPLPLPPLHLQRVALPPPCEGPSATATGGHALGQTGGWCPSGRRSRAPAAPGIGSVDRLASGGGVDPSATGTDTVDPLL